MDGRLPAAVTRLIAAALEEDLGAGDMTSSLTVPEDQESTAVIMAKGSFVVAGLPVAREVLRMVDEAASFEAAAPEGSWVRRGAVVARLSGRTRSLLAAERVMLNFLQRLSGVATLTRKFVKEAEGTGARVLDTRKTTPGMRFLEKYAVRAGGGSNHRLGLYDAILIKENHIAAAGGLGKAVALARAGAPHLCKVEVEVEDMAEFREALRAGADVIMLDNMPLDEIRDAARLARGKALVEVSGNVTLRGVRELALAGVDLISVGALTHSAPAADMSMKIRKP
ncbi:MAG: carboxylating nicotinate-nucleotide diphosphorylase [Thermodesulfovibrionales bacterium]